MAGRTWCDETVTPVDKQAAHQLDITGRFPTGELERTIVECKDKESGEVGQDVLDHLVGVIAQLRLRPYDRENPEPFVKKISLNIVWITSTQADVNVAVAADALPASAAGPIAFYAGTNLLNPDGTPAETLLDVFKANTAPIGPSRAAIRAR